MTVGSSVVKEMKKSMILSPARGYTEGNTEDRSSRESRESLRMDGTKDMRVRQRIR